MPSTLKQVTEHPVFGLRDQLDERIQALYATDQSLSDELSDRCRALASLLTDRITSSDPILIPSTVLENSQGGMQAAINEINNFLGNGNESHIQSAIQHLSSALGSFNSVYRFEDSRSAETFVSEVSKRTVEAIYSLESKVSEVQSELDRKLKEIDELRSRIDVEQQRITNGLGSVENQFTEAQGVRSKAFNDAMSGFDEQFRNELSSTRGELESFLGAQSRKLEERLDAILNAMSELEEDSRLKHQEILALYGLVGRDSQIGGYKEAAQTATDAAKRWDWVTYGFMIFAILALVGPSVVSYAQTGYTDIDWFEVLARFPLSSVLLLPAGYAAAQARRQKKIADTASRNQLHIAALGPYLSTLPEPTQHRIRAILTPRFFYVENPESLDVKQIFEQIEKMDSA